MDSVFVKNKLLAPVRVEQVFGIVVDEPFSQPPVGLVR